MVKVVGYVFGEMRFLVEKDFYVVVVINLVLEFWSEFFVNCILFLIVIYVGCCGIFMLGD